MLRSGRVSFRLPPRLRPRSLPVRPLRDHPAARVAPTDHRAGVDPGDGRCSLRAGWTLLSVASAAGALSLVVLSGCGGAEVPPTTVVQRLVDVEADERLDRERLFDRSEVFEWSFADLRSMEPWSTNLTADELWFEPRGARLKPVQRWFTISRRVQLDAADVDGFDVKVFGLARQPLWVEWSRSGGEPSVAPRVEQPLGKSQPDGSRLYQLQLHGHPEWQGQISEVRFGAVVPQALTPTLVWIQAIRETYRADGLEEALGRSFKVDLGLDVRNARLTLPGHPLEFDDDVLPGSELWFSYGIGSGYRRPLTFEVEGMSADGVRHDVYSDTIDSGADSWRDARVPLPRELSGRVRFRFSVDADPSYDPVLGIPAWANVELVTLGATQPANVIVISIDTLRADHLSLYGYQRPTTPRIDAWAERRGAVFLNAVAPSPWTLPSHVSMMTGLDAHRHGVNFDVGAPSELVMLAEVLRAAGYATLAVTGGGFVHPQYGFDQGFDSYRSHSVQMGIEDELEAGVERALGLLEGYAERPFLLFFHTYEVHNPFLWRDGQFGENLEGVIVDAEILPAEADDGFLGRRRLVMRRDGRPLEVPFDELMRTAVDLYDCELAYTDAAVGRILDRLAALRLEDRTVVILTSDHGELFGEHGLVNHISLYDENLMVPLVVSAPGGRGAGTKIPDQVRSVDIVPTVLDLVGLDGLDGLDGVSLVPLMEGVGALPEHAQRAFSYAAASNYGFSIREGNLAKIIVRNDPWDARGSRVGPWLLEGAPGGLPADQRTRLSRLAAEELASGLNGLRIRFRNTDSHLPLAVALVGRPVQPVRVKTFGTGGPRLRWSPDLGANGVIPAGIDFTLVLEGAGDEPVRLGLPGSGTSGAEYSTTFRAADVQGIERVWRSGGRWHRGRVEEVTGDGVYVWVGGEGPISGSRLAPVDEGLRAQLEALGYVE